MRFELRDTLSASLLAATGLIGGFDAAVAGDDDLSNSVSIAAYGDNDDTRETLAAVAVDFDAGWAELLVGRLEAADDDGSNLTARTISVSGGFDVGSVSLSGGFVDRDDNDSRAQQDLRFALTWFGAKGSIGVDLFYRDSEYETVASIERRLLDPILVPVTQAATGVGLGLHGSLHLSEGYSLYGSFMDYDYDTSTNLPVFLTRWQRIRVSGLTRDELWLDDSVGAGLIGRYDGWRWIADYTRDVALRDAELIQTLTLTLSFDLGEHWTLSPEIGYSDAEIDGSVAFGGLEASLRW